MSNKLNEILDALEKPLIFASRNNFSNLDKVKSLDELVGDLTLKALSLPLSTKQTTDFESLRAFFSAYGGLDHAERIDVIRKSLGIISGLKNDDPKGPGKPVGARAEISGGNTGDETVPIRHASGNSVPDAREPDQVPIQYIKGVGPTDRFHIEEKGDRNG